MLTDLIVSHINLVSMLNGAMLISDVRSYTDGKRDESFKPIISTSLPELCRKFMACLRFQGRLIQV